MFILAKKPLVLTSLALFESCCYTTTHAPTGNLVIPCAGNLISHLTDIKSCSTTNFDLCLSSVYPVAFTILCYINLTFTSKQFFPSNYNKLKMGQAPQRPDMAYQPTQPMSEKPQPQISVSVLPLNDPKFGSKWAFSMWDCMNPCSTCE